MTVARAVPGMLLAAVLYIVSVGAPASAVPRCFGQVPTLIGTAGDDVLKGTRGPDVIWAGDGDDTVQAGAGADLVCGGDGNDFIHLGRGSDRSKGGVGSDGIFGGAGADVLVGEKGADGLSGGPGRDVLRGQRGHDVLSGGDGDDRLAGGPGSEILNGGDGDDRLLGGPGDFDLVSFLQAGGPVTVDLAVTTPQPTGQGIDRITAVEGAEGSRFDDTIFGNDIATPFGNGLFGLDGDDSLDGRQRVDFLFGEAGDDTLLGGPGTDDLTGGEEGEDGPGDFGSGGPGEDTCRELEADDGTCETLERPAAKWLAARDRWEATTSALRRA
jgi:Ca2+-binding RTX toxin-like protein